MNLVTGATGIVGSHVVLALLQSGQPVLAGRRKGSNLAQVEKLFSYYTKNYKQLFEKIKWIDIDIEDVFSIEEALGGIDNVYHCAGFVSFKNTDRKKLFAINEKGTKNVVDACLTKEIKVLCHVSSIAAIHNLDYTLPLSEDVFWKKSGKENDYALSKYNAEREVWRGMEEGLNAVIVNPGFVLSPGFWKQSSSVLFNTCYKGNKFYTQGISAYVAATDVAKAMLALVSQQKFGQRYIVIEGNYSYRQIFSSVQTQFGKPVPSINASPILLKMAGMLEPIAYFFTGRTPMLTKSLINSAFNIQEYSNQKIKKELAFEFTPVKQELERICKLYLQDKAED